MQAFKLKAFIWVRDDRERAAFIDFIEEFWINHIKFLNYVHRYVISDKSTLKDEFYFTRPRPFWKI